MLPAGGPGLHGLWRLVRGRENGDRQYGGNVAVCSTIACLATVSGSSALQAQDVLNWGDFEFCEDCPLSLTEVVRLGDLEGPGVVESESVDVSWSEAVGYVVYAVDGASVKLFDHHGGFKRIVGGPGEGPGEFKFIADAHVVDNRIVVLDAGKRSWVIFDQDGSLAVEHRLDLTPGTFQPVGDNHVVVASIDRRPSIVGLPLHLVDLAGQEVALHFGQETANWTITNPYAESVRASSASRQGTVWWGNASSPRVEQWTTDGQQIAVVGGALPWFEPFEGGLPQVGEDPPPPELGELAEDARGHLWMISYTADPEWHEVDFQSEGGEVFFPVAQFPDYWDARIDAFDLSGRRRIGSRVWDTMHIGFVNHDGRPVDAPMVHVLEYDEAMVPQVVVYRLGTG